MADKQKGRPSKFKPEFVEQAQKLCALGATDREVAEFLNVTESTLYLWKHEHTEFSEALKVGKGTADERVERSLYRKAIGYTMDDTHFSAHDGVVTQTPYIKHIPPDTTACIFWLKNRQPDQWRERVEHTGKDGKDLLPAVSPTEFCREMLFELELAQREKKSRPATTQH